jgi:hypothetical protein
MCPSHLKRLAQILNYLRGSKTFFQALQQTTSNPSQFWCTLVALASKIETSSTAASSETVETPSLSLKRTSATLLSVSQLLQRNRMWVSKQLCLRHLVQRKLEIVEARAH